MLNLTEPTYFKQFAPVLYFHDGGNHTSNSQQFNGFSRNLEAQEALHGSKERGRRGKKILQICDRISTKLMVDFMCILSSHNC
jgi:hypothetical protein